MAPAWPSARPSEPATLPGSCRALGALTTRQPPTCTHMRRFYPAPVPGIICLWAGRRNFRLPRPFFRISLWIHPPPIVVIFLGFWCCFSACFVGGFWGWGVAFSTSAAGLVGAMRSRLVGWSPVGPLMHMPRQGRKAAPWIACVSASRAGSYAAMACWRCSSSSKSHSR